MSLKDIFNSVRNKPIIGALHFSPLIGYKGFKSMEDVLDMALKDAAAFENGGADSIIIENNYDIPHKIHVGPETVSAMTYLGAEIKRRTKLPLGVSVLWNDYKSAFAIAVALGAKFIRVPVFVDSVKTDFGTVIADPEDVLRTRSDFGADKVQIFADIQVKHATILKSRSVSESAIDAERKGADAIVITGEWTGDAPDMSDLKEARGCVKIPIVIGSGLSYNNAKTLFEYADVAIVSTSVKEGRIVEGERNLKPYNSRVSVKKVRALVDAVSGKN